MNTPKFRGAGEIMIHLMERLGEPVESLRPLPAYLMDQAAQHRRAGRLDEATVSERTAGDLTRALERHRPSDVTLH
jgi:hypothetical protein